MRLAAILLRFALDATAAAVACVVWVGLLATVAALAYAWLTLP